MGKERAWEYRYVVHLPSSLSLERRTRAISDFESWLNGNTETTALYVSDNVTITEIKVPVKR